MSLFPINRVRDRFPALTIRDSDKPNRIYFDGPAGTQVPQSVADAVYHCLLETNANVGGHFVTSKAADTVVSAAHEAMACFLGTSDPGEIVLGANMTTLTFHISRSICRSFKPGDEIVLTKMDHEGNVSPWLKIARDLGLVIRWLPFDEYSWRVEPAALASLLSSRTRLVALNFASNMTGAVNPIRELSAEAKKVGAIVYVDAVQYAPHGLIDVSALGCDYLVCSSYKFFGPHLGILWGRRNLLTRLDAYKCRCVSNEIGEKLETGTPAIELLAGLTACVDYFEWLGNEIVTGLPRRESISAAISAADRYELDLAELLISRLQDMQGVEIIGPSKALSPDTRRIPTVSFRHSSVASVLIAKGLAGENIFVWDGHNYALGITEQLGLSPDAAVRIGFAHYNTLSEVEFTLSIISRILQSFDRCSDDPDNFVMSADSEPLSLQVKRVRPASRY